MARKKTEESGQDGLVEIKLPDGSVKRVDPAVAKAIRDLQAAGAEEPVEPGDVPIVDGKVLVDYNSVIARAPGQDEIRHIDTPMVYPWPELGRLELVLQPGLSLQDPEQWNFYGVLDAEGKPGRGKPQLKPLIRDGEVKVLSKLPSNESDLKDLISRTRDPDALQFMRGVIAEGKAEYYDHAKNEDRSEILLRLIDKRLASSNRLDYRAAPYRARPTGVNHGKTVTPGMAMGA